MHSQFNPERGPCVRRPHAQGRPAILKRLVLPLVFACAVWTSPASAFHWTITDTTGQSVAAPAPAGMWNLAHPGGWAMFMNPATYAQMMNPATYAQFMNPAFYMQFADPNNWMAWMNPAAYAQFMNPATYMQWMNPAAYAQLMNPVTYMQWMNPASYAAFMNPTTYLQWMNPAAYAMPTGTDAPGGQAIFDPFDPSTWMPAPDDHAEHEAHEDTDAATEDDADAKTE